MNISMLGSGYVGLVAGVCFADAGHNVICVDSNQKKIALLNDGKVPFYEPGLEDLYKLNRRRMRFTADIVTAVHESEVIFIAVGTPELMDGSADIEPTMKIFEQICQAAREDKIIVLKSTVPIGTARHVQRYCDDHCQFNLEVINNPEFLRQGAALEDFLRPDRVVIGTRSEKARQVMQDLYQPFLKTGHPIIFMDNTSAEMTKYAANSFLALKISFINELALLADEVGANITQVREGFTSDSRINPAFFYPGIGYGGSCFPKDVRALRHTAQKHNLEFLLLDAIDAVNERQKTILSQRLRKKFGNLSGKKIAIWGLAFKPRTDDVRRAPSLDLIADLVNKGATVSAYDPIAMQNAKAACTVDFKACETAMDAAQGADALVLVTEWNEFKSVDFDKLKQCMQQAVIFDGRNIFNEAKMQQAGFEYYGIGHQTR